MNQRTFHSIASTKMTVSSDSGEAQVASIQFFTNKLQLRREVKRSGQTDIILFTPSKRAPYK